MKPIILLSGPIGAGKTTIARELVALSPAPVASIEGDTFWSFIAKGVSKKDRPRDFKMVMRAMVSAAGAYALGGYETIVDFSIPPWFLPTALKIAQFRELPLDYVVLRPSEPVCAQRAGSRAEGTIADYSIYHELYMDFGDAERYTISDDESDPRALALRIREGLDAGRFRVF